MPRTIAIGDIHGFTTALDSLLAHVGPEPDDTLVLLGDYVDRGPDSRGTIDRLIALERQCHLAPILGNHDHLFVEICRGRKDVRAEWLGYGGSQTVTSYRQVPEGVPPEHLDFLDRCLRRFETDTHLFFHANYDPKLPADEQPTAVSLWHSLRDRLPGPHISGKTVILGHTAQKNGEIFDLGYLKCLDTYLYGGGWLTALDVGSNQVWQVNQTGQLRLR